MKKYFKKTKKIKKYCSLYTINKIIVWEARKKSLLIISKLIIRQDDSRFYIKISANSINHYHGPLEEEYRRIKDGERKVLFYDDKDINKNVDIKSQWEGKRLQFLPILARACQTDNEIQEYFQEDYLNGLLEDTNAMEVAISTINVIESINILKKRHICYSETNINGFIKKSLVYMLENNEIGLGYSNNHLFFNLIGILWVMENIESSLYWGNVKYLAYKYMYSFLKVTLLKDGSLYEGSTYYHKYVTEALLLFLNMSDCRNKKILQYAKKMYEFSMYAAFGDHLIGIGDNDSGRILGYPEYFSYSSYNLAFLNKIASNIGLSTPTKNRLEEIGEINKSSKSSFGIIKIEQDGWRVCLRCDLGRKKTVRKIIGAHFHNDQLSILVMYQNEMILVDTGVYSYILKDNCRINNIMTSSHNTIIVDGREQNRISNDWCYQERKAIGEIKGFRKNEIEAQYKLDQDITISRKVEIKRFLHVEDRIECKGGRIEIFYHFSPKCNIRIENNKEAIITSENNTFRFKSNEDIKLLCSYYSPEYGEKIRINVIVINKIIMEFEKARERSFFIDSYIEKVE